MVGALLLGLVAGFIGRALVPNDVFAGMEGAKSWLVSIALGLVGAARRLADLHGWTWDRRRRRVRLGRHPERDDRRCHRSSRCGLGDAAPRLQQRARSGARHSGRAPLHLRGRSCRSRRRLREILRGRCRRRTWRSCGGCTRPSRRQCRRRVGLLRPGRGDRRVPCGWKAGSATVATSSTR